MWFKNVLACKIHAFLSFLKLYFCKMSAAVLKSIIIPVGFFRIIKMVLILWRGSKKAWYIFSLHLQLRIMLLCYMNYTTTWILLPDGLDLWPKYFCGSENVGTGFDLLMLSIEPICSLSRKYTSPSYATIYQNVCTVYSYSSLCMGLSQNKILQIIGEISAKQS